MKIEINNSNILDIAEEHLVIKNNRLYNNATKQYEGIEGDRVTFYTRTASGAKCFTSGTVDGYTCGRKVKLLGVSKAYEIAEDCIKIIDHISKITNTECDNKEVWDVILSA